MPVLGGVTSLSLHHSETGTSDVKFLFLWKRAAAGKLACESIISHLDTFPTNIERPKACMCSVWRILKAFWKQESQSSLAKRNCVCAF